MTHEVTPPRVAALTYVSVFRHALSFPSRAESRRVSDFRDVTFATQAGRGVSGGTRGAMSRGMNTTTKTTYETPMGTFRTWEEAADACERADLDPCDCIKMVHSSAPVPPSLVSYELGPGGLVRLSFQIKCF